MSSRYIHQTVCRLCNGKFERLFSLGNICTSNFIQESETEPNTVPLVLVKCATCNLLQLEDTADQDDLYSQYWYQSSLNTSMIEALKDVVKGVEERVQLNNNDFVCDIGCNDGVLFDFYTNKNLYKIGIDPAKNLAISAEKHCTEFINDYYNVDHLGGRKMKVITSIAMFYDLQDPHAFVEGIKKSLDKDGIWVVQFMDLLNMINTLGFDNICHEHLEYYSLEILIDLFKQHGLQVFDLETNKTNGGSVRLYVCHLGKRHMEVSVVRYLEKEQVLNDLTYKQFANGVGSRRLKVKKLLQQLKSKKKSIAAIGASTKGNTLLQYFNLDDKIINFIAEVNPDKFGKKTVATNIPIISEKEALKRNPDYFLVLIWHFSASLIPTYRDYIKNGGNLIIPLPELTIVNEESLDQFNNTK